MEINTVNIPTEPHECPNCHFFMDMWHWLRFSGHGPWSVSPWECEQCGLLRDGTKRKEIIMAPMPFIKQGSHRGAAITSSKAKWDDDINHRKLLPNGDVAIVSDKGEIKEVRAKGTRLRDLK